MILVVAWPFRAKAMLNALIADFPPRLTTRRRTSLEGSVALVIRQRNFAGTALRRSNWTEHSRQRRKLVGERHRMRAVVRELALADHVDQFDAGEDGAGGAE